MSHQMMKLLKTQNGDVSEETTGDRKVKKSKHSINVALSETQNADISQEIVENVKVKKSPQKSTVLTNGDAEMQSPNSESKKKKKKKKRKLVNDAGPDTKKAKTENKGESEEESAKTPKETENNVEKLDNDEDDSEVPSLPLGLTGAFEDTSFASLCNLVNENTLKAIKEMGFTNMAEIQHKSIRLLLEGRDLLAAVKTGSGKALAFFISAVELIVKLKLMPKNGTGVLILSPTRQLAMQIFGVLKELMTQHVHTYGLIIGGSNRSKLANGIYIIVVTPGRLLDHMQNTPGFMYKNLQCLAIDEADCILDVGFEDKLKQIIKLLPTRRQTMLFEDQARISLKKEPLYVDVDVDGLEQGYVILLLFTFFKKNQKKKLMVFSSCMSVKYHYELLNCIDLLSWPFMESKSKISVQPHSSRSQEDWTFLKSTGFFSMTLQMALKYIHRVGRTARDLNGGGHALLISHPEELGFLHYLKQSKDTQSQLEKLIEKNYFLHKSAEEASYDSYSLKQIFNVNNLNFPQVALSFGFKVPPFVGLNMNSNEGKQKKQGGFGYQKTKKVEKSIIFKHISKNKCLSPSLLFSHL
uniref:ATP-dependent RNA helicase n=1 Tax=Macaca nemestrina TaxID=9545 RepID=A0A2K6BQM5_MACNE